MQGGVQGGVQGTSPTTSTNTNANPPHARAWGNYSDSHQVQQAARSTRPPPPALPRQQQRPMAPGLLDAQGDGEVMMRGYENRTNGSEGWAHQPQGFSPNTLAPTQQQVPTPTLPLQGIIAQERKRTGTGYSLDFENSDSFYC